MPVFGGPFMSPRHITIRFSDKIMFMKYVSSGR